MEKLIKILLIALVMLSGCKTTRKNTQSTDFKSSVNTEENRSVKENNDFKENKDVNSELVTVTVKTTKKYYPPTASPSTLESSGTGGAVNPSTLRQAQGSAGSGTGSEEPEIKGALMEETTETTTTNEKEQDKSKVEATSAKQEDTSKKKKQELEEHKEFKELKKTGVAQWKVIVGVLALLLVLYFLVQKGIIKVPLLTKAANWIKGILGTPKGKAA